jgi:hypothetical protein
MKSDVSSSLRRTLLLPAVALAMFAALPAAALADQQATPAEIDNAQNWRAARGAGLDGYAQVVRPGRFLHERTYR